MLILVQRAHNTEGSSLCQFLPLTFKSRNILVFNPYRSNPLVRSTCPFVCGCADDEGWWWISKSTQHLENLATLNWVPLSIRTLLGTPNLHMMLCRNLTIASCVMFTIRVASIHLVNILMPMNNNQNPPGALGRMPTMLIPQIAKGQKRSIGWRGFTCFMICFWKNCQSLHLVMISIASSLTVSQ
jgi:hypothetical protein